MNIGDKVEWVPSIEMHLEMKDGKYAWEHAVKRGNDLKPLTTEQVVAFLKQNAKRPETLKLLIATKPQCTYPATVTASEGDNVELDVTSPIGGITLHIPNVAVDPSGAPGTCH